MNENMRNTEWDQKIFERTEEVSKIATEHCPRGAGVNHDPKKDEQKGRTQSGLCYAAFHEHMLPQQCLTNDFRAIETQNEAAGQNVLQRPRRKED